MDIVIITKQLLVHLYNAFFLSDDNFNLRDFAEKEGWLQERTAFWNLVNELTEGDRLIQRAGVGGVYKITLSSPLVLCGATIKAGYALVKEIIPNLR